MLGGAAIIVLSVVWFVTAYAETMDTVSRFGGNGMGAKLIACLYSSSAICQGAGFLGSAPSYSPVVFWIGVIALLAGVVVRFAMATPASGGAPAGSPASSSDGQPATAQGEILGFIPAQQYARYTYILFLAGAAAGLLLPPLLIVALAGLVLGLLGLVVFKPRLSALDSSHLVALCVVSGVAFVILLITRGSFLWLLAALVQLALYYIGFNSYRHGRTIDMQNLQDEARMAIKNR